MHDAVIDGKVGDIFESSFDPKNVDWKEFHESNDKWQNTFSLIVVLATVIYAALFRIRVCGVPLTSLAPVQHIIVVVIIMASWLSESPSWLSVSLLSYSSSSVVSSSSLGS